MEEIEIKREADGLMRVFAEKLGIEHVDYYIKDRADGPYLVFEMVEPSERVFRVLKTVTDSLGETHVFKERVTSMRRRKAITDRLSTPEVQMLRKTLSESLTVDRHTFQDDFFSRYTKSVFDFESHIVTNANFTVYGRRGSGKSSLLAYALHKLEAEKRPYAWISMQAYAGRGDVHVSIDVLVDFIAELERFLINEDELVAIKNVLSSTVDMVDVDADRILQRILPRIRRVVGKVAEKYEGVSFFVDDFHVLKQEYQPEFLGYLYSVARGNRVYLKISGIEQFSRLWDANKQRGLETPHDTQILKLDYNLTMPDRSREHIVMILDAHAKYCAIPHISWLASSDVLSRLVWVAAAVPRDALNLFAQALTKAAAQNQKRVSVTSINVAASEMTEQKLKDIQADSGTGDPAIQKILEQVKKFCIDEQRKNAFLVEIDNSDLVYQSLLKLIALRLVHVLHEGITPYQAGKRFVALMLDYGFYVGIRAAKSIDLFQKEPKALLAKDVRKLPIFRGNPAALAENL